MKTNPLIVLIDMDCFYVQVELKAAPQYLNKECAVVQYNSWRGGGIIAVSYEARAKGVNRSMRGDEAKQKCPDIHLFSVPETRGKADLTKYRNAGAEVIKCLSKHANCIERASIDEAYIDLTDEVDKLVIDSTDSQILETFWDSNQHSSAGCHIVGYGCYQDWLNHVMQLREVNADSDDVRLAIGAFLVQKMRDDVYNTLGYRCSAGIAHSKVVAKYACGVHKPNQQTIVPISQISNLLLNAPIDKIRNLGGKMGNYVQEQLKISTMGQLSQFSLSELSDRFGEKTGSWLYYLCRGQDEESVLSRQLAQSIGCSKTFPGANQLNSAEKVRYWLGQMAQEIAERVNEDSLANTRLPSHMCVSYRQLRDDNSSSRSYSASRVVPLGELTGSAISKAAYVVLSGINTAGHRDLGEGAWHPPLLSLGLSAGKFKPRVAQNDISRFLVDCPMKKSIKFPEKPKKTVSIEDPTLEDSNPVSMDSVMSSITSSSPLKLENPLIKAESSSPPPHNSNSPSHSTATKSESLAILQLKNEPNLSLTPKKKGFFARLRENEVKIEEEREEIITTRPVEMPSQLPAVSAEVVVPDSSDYFHCTQCSKDILMWEAPEHGDWHLARTLQKELSQQIFEEEAKARQAKQNQRNIKLKRKQNTPSKPKSNQLTIDRFFRK